MSSLVADYGSSGDSDEPQNISDSCDSYKESAAQDFKSNGSSDYKIDDVIVPVEPKKKKKLLNPLLRKKAGNKLLQTASVFYNPFLKEIDNKKSVLERHVKMTANPKDLGEINGKKICWNHRKGKCRFGHNCKYAHQSDLANGNVPPSNTDNGPSVVPEPPTPVYETVHATITSEDNNPRKRKPGLSDSLLPNKKALKMYKKQQQSEQPWLR